MNLTHGALMAAREGGRADNSDSSVLIKMAEWCLGRTSARGRAGRGTN
jgi:hypothetical protein